MCFQVIVIAPVASTATPLGVTLVGAAGGAVSATVTEVAEYADVSAGVVVVAANLYACVTVVTGDACVYDVAVPPSVVNGEPSHTPFAACHTWMPVAHGGFPVHVSAMLVAPLVGTGVPGALGVVDRVFDEPLYVLEPAPLRARTRQAYL